MKQLQPVHFAVVGVKGVGQLHVEAMRKVKEARLVAVADVDAEAAQACGEENGVPWFQDYHDLYRIEGLEAVDVATPHFLHCPMAIDTLQAGFHAFVEKPICRTVSEGDRMAAMARSTRRILGVCHNYRTWPYIPIAKKLIEEGRLGRITNVVWSACRIRTQAYYDSAPWRGTWKGEGGGVVMTQAIHDLDALHYILGKACRVTGRLGRLLHNSEVDNVAGAIIEFESGATCVFHATLINAPERSCMEIYGDKATLILGDETRLGTPEMPVPEFVEKDKGMWSVPPSTWEVLEQQANETDHAPMFRDFARAVREGGEPMVTGEDATESLELANAITLSHFTGRPIELPLNRDEYDQLIADLVSGKRKL